MDSNRRKKKAVSNGRIGSPSGDDGPQNKRLEPSHREAAEYIASMLEALQQVAGSAKMPFLAYLINVALEEARLEKAKRD